ncbi:hypothetical protein ACLOJK_026676, partial [Asimina triloba]
TEPNRGSVLKPGLDRILVHQDVEVVKMVSELRSRAIRVENSGHQANVVVDQPGPSYKGTSKNLMYVETLNRCMDEQVAEHNKFKNE